MTENEIVNDVLNRLNSALTCYASAVSQAKNPDLRSIFIELQNQAEKAKKDLYQIAKRLNYDIPDQQTSQDEIMKVEYSSTNYISSQSNGILKHMDEQTAHALQAPPKSHITIVSK